MITTQKQVRSVFWETHPELSRKKITHYSGTGKMYNTDTRCAFVDFISYLSDTDQISVSMADKVTL